MNDSKSAQLADLMENSSAPNTQAGRPWEGEGAVPCTAGELESWGCCVLAEGFMVSWLNGGEPRARPGGSQERHLQITIQTWVGKQLVL